MHITGGTQHKILLKCGVNFDMNPRKTKNAYLAEVMFFGLFVLTYDPRSAGASVVWRLERGRRIFSNEEPHETKRGITVGFLETENNLGIKRGQFNTAQCEGWCDDLKELSHSLFWPRKKLPLN